MKRKTKLPELLAPAGSYEALLAAVSAGADAVYIGGKSFGARAYAKNFDIDEIKRAVELCHIHNVKLYVTVNTLVYDKEMAELSDFAAELYKIGVDALICADLGAISEIRRRCPGLPIHASTQMSVHNTDGANAAAALGCERVVLARELSGENIRTVTENCLPETEIFLHGALCVCHSGQCLFSSLVGGRSGNRGECAQPCRLPYGKGYPLSLKDLSLSNHIKELIESGASSLKIEGRMKSPEYVYRVTKIYRELLDSHRNSTSKEEGELKEIFSRGGFTDGYYSNKLEKGMTGVRSESDKEKTHALDTVIPPPERVKATAVCKMKLGMPSELTLSARGRSVTVYGQEPRAAQSSPLTEQSVKARLMKMGATELSLSEEDIDLSLDGGINLSPGEINALRREAVSALINTERDVENAEKFLFTPSPVQKKALKTAYFYDPKILSELESKSPEALTLFDKIYIPLHRLCEYSGSLAGVALPPIIFDSETESIEKMLAAARERGIKEALISNLSHKRIADRHGFSVMGDFRLNITNRGSLSAYRKMGIDDAILSPELTLPMARDIGGSVIVYGRIPLMLTERCFIKENFGCEKCSKASLTDRTGAKFPMLREFEHRNIILNSTPTYMGDKQDELAAARISSHHFLFFTESAKEISEIISSYKNKKPLPYAVRRIGKR